MDFVHLDSTSATNPPSPVAALPRFALFGLVLGFFNGITRAIEWLVDKVAGVTQGPVSSMAVSWNTPPILTISSILGLLAVVQSSSLMHLGDTVWHLDRPHLQTMMFLQLAAGGHLMLFPARTLKPFWKPPYPTPKLFWAIIGTQTFAVFVSAFGWGVPALPWNLVGWVWVYNLAWMIVQDLIKVCTLQELDHRAAGTTPFLARLKTSLHPYGRI